MADSMLFDALAEDETVRRSAVTLSRAGRLRIVTTHIQEDELAAVRDLSKYWRIKSIPRSIILTSDFVADVSRLDMARLGDGRAYELIRVGHHHIGDALIAATAEHEGLTLVTNDRRLTNQTSTKLRVPIWSIEDFLAWMKNQ